jgi:hypothetical protein
MNIPLAPVPPGDPAADAPPPEVAVRAEVASRITFATHQCDAPVILDLVVENPLTTDLDGLTLHLSAEPRVLVERTWTFDRLAAGGELRPRDRRVSIAGGLLDGLTERMRAAVHLELKQGETLLATASCPIIALARNEWGGARYMPELLAAFVTPNDPAVQRLLREASNLLRDAGKPPSLEGYQSRSRKRAWEIVDGIWAAVAMRGLTYAEPPASFENDGQKIRLPSEIEANRLATCLDLALLFAAAIEQAGLYPLVVFTKGHALAGAWLQPQGLPGLTTDDPMEIRKAIDRKELLLFETTMAAAGHALPLAKAAAEARRQLDIENEDAFVYAIDIHQARGRDIQPLSSVAPAPTRNGEPAGEPVRGAPPLGEAPDLPPFDGDTTIVEEMPQTPEERLERWKRSLLDLSKRNRLLNLRPSATAIPIFCPDIATLEDRIAAGQRIRIVTPPVTPASEDTPDPVLYHLRTGDDRSLRFAEEALGRNEIVANVDEKALEKGAIELFRKAKADFEEGGANTLFLALGMLRWMPTGTAGHAGARSYRAPLIMLPVRLERRSARSKPYLVGHDDEPIFNLTLLQMLRQDFAIAIPELAERLPTDDHGVDVAQVWKIVRDRVREVPGFELLEEVALSTFSFAKFLMWKDLADRTETLKVSPFVRHMIDTPRDPYSTGARFLDPREIDARIDPAELMAPLNADSSQIVAVHASGTAGDFVLEGPPGTGKSETIGNIIAHNLGLGRRVLFVSEKMAALDVVYRRLSACGLGDFCLELHSAKANKAAVLAQLGAAWEKRRTHPVAEWKRKAAKLGEIRAQLNGLVEALHAPGPGGVSPRDAVGRALRYGDVHRLALDWPHDPGDHGHAPTPEALEHLEELAKRLGQQFAQLQPGDLAAFAGISHSDWSFAWQGAIVVAARALETAIRELVRARAGFAARLSLGEPGDSVEEAAALAAIAALVPDLHRTNLGFALDAAGRETIDTLERAGAKLAAYRAAKAKLSTPYADARIAAGPFADWIAARDRAKARIWPLSALTRGRLRHTIRDGMGVTKKEVRKPERDLEGLRDLAALRAELAALERSLPERAPWRGLDTDIEANGAALGTAKALREAVVRFASHGRELVETRATMTRALCDGRDLLEPGLAAATAARELVAAEAGLRRALADFAASATVDAEGKSLGELAGLCAGLAAREKRLNLWCAWIEIRRNADAAGLGALVSALEAGAVAPDQAVEALRTAYCVWVAPILIDARPELQRFSAVRHEDLIATFRDLDAELAALTADYIRAKLSAGVPARDQGGADPGFGVLSRELQKRMRHKPVRQLVTEMGEALTALTPCLMMSPLSVAQFLPADIALFDLVVFDEASQITVPDAIGAIARGQHCIVVGDPRQMPPTRFFEKGAEDDENEDARDLESILDEALAARVPHHRLTGHYRSRHESLICFSNHAYYHGSLVTYPAAETRETAVSLRRVDGIYAKGKARTNPIEARAVVNEVVRRLGHPELAALSIGVVTLNSEQQRLVEDLLDEERRADPELERFFGPDAEEPVFVKNLETVQGDQRDVILLSIGYGPTEPGARTMSMNFGPLNRQGGERRLNVAITRATTEVVVFASFDPAMIDLTRTSAEAVRDLKHYLDFAARGPAALGAAIRAFGASNAYDTDFEMAVADGLREKGWTVMTQIGVSKFRIDLGVVHPDAPGRFLAGVECDGATYHSTPTARDRDRVRHIILENLGWRLFRIWSTDFFIDAVGSVAVLDSKLRALLEDDRAREAEAAAAEASAAESAGTPEELPATDTWDENSGARSADSADCAGEGAADPDAFRSERPVRVARAPASTGVPGAVVAEPARFYDPGYRGRLQAMAREIIDAEGPITFKRLSDRIARAHGFQRTGKEISRTVWAACHRVRTHIRTPDEHEVFWPEDREPAEIIAFRGLRIGDETREWREVPYPEKVGLVRAILTTADDVDIARMVADAIGFQRITSQFRAEIDALAERVAAAK